MMRSTPGTLEWWVRANRANARPAPEEPLPNHDTGDGCRIYRTLYPASGKGAPVLFYRIEGGGHAMPSIQFQIPSGPLARRLIGTASSDAEGAELAWQFMRQHRRQ